jgi:hypothetical protein
LAHEFLWEYSYKRLQLAQLLGQLDVCFSTQIWPLTLALFCSLWLSHLLRHDGLERGAEGLQPQHVLAYPWAVKSFSCHPVYLYG